VLEREQTRAQAEAWIPATRHSHADCVKIYTQPASLDALICDFGPEIVMALRLLKVS
jgi:hypothetical protein